MRNRKLRAYKLIFFFSAVYSMHPGLWLEGVCLQKLEARIVWVLGFSVDLSNPRAAQHMENIAFSWSNCALDWCEAGRFGCPPLWMEGCLPIWLFNPGRGWLERHPFAALEVLCSQPFHWCNLGLLFLILWLSAQEPSLALPLPNLNCMFLLI